MGAATNSGGFVAVSTSFAFDRLGLIKLNESASSSYSNVFLAWIRVGVVPFLFLELLLSEEKLKFSTR